MKEFVTYEEFGAKGDGVADDMPAIVACHAYANENGLTSSHGTSPVTTSAAEL